MCKTRPSVDDWFQIYTTRACVGSWHHWRLLEQVVFTWHAAMGVFIEPTPFLQHLLVIILSRFFQRVPLQANVPPVMSTMTDSGITIHETPLVFGIWVRS